MYFHNVFHTHKNKINSYLCSIAHTSTQFISFNDFRAGNFHISRRDAEIAMNLQPSYVKAIVIGKRH